MTEAEWLACTDPIEIAVFLGDTLGGDSLGDTIGDRKLRLFGCACVRGVWDYLPKNALCRAIETCERFADGLATAEELKAAEELADGTYQGIGNIIADHSAIAVGALCAPEPDFPMGTGSSAGIAAVAAEAWFNEEVPWHVAHAQAEQAHPHLLRDILGNPFRPVRRDPTYLTANVVNLAKALYEERELPSGRLDNTRLGILADVLEEAGCTNADILAHCRTPGPHVRGCWVVDLILGRS